MASFFRKRVAHKVLSMLSKQQDLKWTSSPNLLSSLVKVNRFKSAEPQLVLPWKRLEQICKEEISVSPKDFIRVLRNQGLPTAEGFVDIHLSESPVLSLVFTVDKHIFSKIILLDIVNSESNPARNSCLFEDIEKKKVVVNCSVPSIGEICHLTHFRSLIHSRFVANIEKFVGHRVTTVAHVKDWGPEIAAFVYGYKKFKDKRIVLHKEKNHLLEIYKAAILAYDSDLNFKMSADSIYDKMKQGDSSILSEYEHLRQKCIRYYDSIYQRIGIHFDDYCFDSMCYKKSEDIANKLSEIVLNKDGSKKTFPDFPDDGYFHSVEDVQSALYNLSRHISAASEAKEKYDFDMMFYVAPLSQSDFLSTLFYMMNKLNYAWVDDLHEVPLKVVSSFDSKRRKKIGIDEVLDLIKEKTMLKLHESLQMDLNESLEEMSEELSVSSLIINDMKHRRKVDYDFKWDDIISFKKDTAASFQFCSAGLKGLQEDSDYTIFKDDTDTSALLEPQAHYLIQHLARFDEMVFKSYTLLEPCIIYQYLSTLWYLTDQMTNKLKLDIKTVRTRPIKARLLLLLATLKVLNTGLHILGITPLKNVYSQEKKFVHNT